MAILGPKDVFKKVRNWHYTSLGSSSIQTFGFIALKPCLMACPTKIEWIRHQKHQNRLRNDPSTPFFHRWPWFLSPNWPFLVKITISSTKWPFLVRFWCFLCLFPHFQPCQIDFWPYQVKKINSWACFLDKTDWKQILRYHEPFSTFPKRHFWSDFGHFGGYFHIFNPAESIFGQSRSIKSLL